MSVKSILSQDEIDALLRPFSRPEAISYSDDLVSLTVELGHASISMDDLLQLARGDVLPLDCLPSAPLTVVFDGVIVGHAELVQMNNRLSIRLIDVNPQR